jgi:hypothetical protein
MGVALTKIPGVKRSTIAETEKPAKKEKAAKVVETPATKEKKAKKEREEEAPPEPKKEKPAKNLTKLAEKAEKTEEVATKKAKSAAHAFVDGPVAEIGATLLAMYENREGNDAKLQKLGVQCFKLLVEAYEQCGLSLADPNDSAQYTINGKKHEVETVLKRRAADKAKK